MQTSTNGDPIRTSFPAWLHGPVLDLRPAIARAPFPTQAVQFELRRLESDGRHPQLRTSHLPRLRGELCAAAGLQDYDVAHPAHLQAHRQTPEWERLCELLERFDALAVTLRVQVAWLLSKLSFDGLLLELVAEPSDNEVGGDADHALLGYLRALSAYKRWISGEDDRYTLEAMERIARLAAPGAARVHALYHMVAHNAKHHADLEACEHWQELHCVALEEHRAEIDDAPYRALLSRLHRVGGFIPQLRRDPAGVAAEMTAAEELARGLPRDDATACVVADELLFPALESRAREAVWAGDLALAEQRTRECVAISPYDSLGWLRHGEVLLDADCAEKALDAFLFAARLGPPTQSEALFMAGQCLEALGRLEAAEHAYLDSLRGDPLGISAAERLLDVASRREDAALLEWATHQVSNLRARVAIAQKVPQPYRDMPGLRDQAA